MSFARLRNGRQHIFSTVGLNELGTTNEKFFSVGHCLSMIVISLVESQLTFSAVEVAELTKWSATNANDVILLLRMALKNK